MTFRFILAMALFCSAGEVPFGGPVPEIAQSSCERNPQLCS